MNTGPAAAACLLLSALAAAPARGEEAMAPYPRARQLASEKSWAPARLAALEATERDPASAQAWFLLGIIEERLEQAGPAAKAYGKAADLEAASPLGRAAAERRVTLGAKAKSEAQAKYNQESAGFNLEYVPRLPPGPGYDGRLGAKVDTAFGLGVRTGSGSGNMALMLRYSSGKVPRFTSPNKAPAAPTTFTNGDLQNYEFRYEFAVPVAKPYAKLGLVGLDLPLSLNILYATLKTAGKTLEGGEFGLSGGLRASLYSRSPFVFHVAALYSWAKSPGINEWGHDPISGPTGQRTSGAFSGLELRVGMTLLFGNTLPPELD